MELRAGPQRQAAPGGDLGPAHHPVAAVQRLLGRVQHPGVSLEASGDNRAHHVCVEWRQSLTDPAGLPGLITPGWLRFTHQGIIAGPRAAWRAVIRAGRARQAASGQPEVRAWPPHAAWSPGARDAKELSGYKDIASSLVARRFLWRPSLAVRMGGVSRSAASSLVLSSRTVPTAIHHAVVIVRDLDASLRFYRDEPGLDLFAGPASRG